MTKLASIDWKVINVLRVVSFDVAKTLIDLYYFDHVWNEVIPRLYAKKKGLTFLEAKDYVLSDYDRIGNNDIRWYLPEYWFKRFNLDEDPIEVFRSHTDKIRFYPEVSSVLKNLNQRYTLITASGIPRDYQEIILEDFRSYFTHIFSSISDLRVVEKTNIFYETICKALEVEPDAVVHVGDDRQSDFIAPRNIGIESYLLDRKGETSGQFVLKDLTELEDRLKQ